MRFQCNKLSQISNLRHAKVFANYWLYMQSVQLECTSLPQPLSHSLPLFLPQPFSCPPPTSFSYVLTCNIATHTSVTGVSLSWPHHHHFDSWYSQHQLPHHRHQWPASAAASMQRVADSISVSQCASRMRKYQSHLHLVSQTAIIDSPAIREWSTPSLSGSSRLATSVDLFKIITALFSIHYSS